MTFCQGQSSSVTRRLVFPSNARWSAQALLQHRTSVKYILFICLNYFWFLSNSIIINKMKMIYFDHICNIPEAETHKKLMV